MNEEVFAKGKIFELVHETQPDGRVFEIARRAPGVRLIIFDEKKQKLLITKEFRKELNGYDYRLPGGKVFDTLEEFEKFRQTGGNLENAAQAKAKAEGREEAGVGVNFLRSVGVSRLGATVEWDLYVFEATEWFLHKNGQALENGEDIDASGWYSLSEVRKMILDGTMQEERIAMILLRWIERRQR